MSAPWRVQGEHVGSPAPSAGDVGILDVCFPLRRVVLNVDADTLQCLLIADDVFVVVNTIDQKTWC